MSWCGRLVSKKITLRAWFPFCENHGWVGMHTLVFVMGWLSLNCPSHSWKHTYFNASKTFNGALNQTEPNEANAELVELEWCFCFLVWVSNLSVAFLPSSKCMRCDSLSTCNINKGIAQNSFRSFTSQDYSIHDRLKMDFVKLEKRVLL